MKKITLISVLAILRLYTTAQEELIKPLMIGDTLPNDLVLTNVYNYPDSTIHLSDLKGKLVILDFWTTWCGSCISLFPHLQELQDRFKDSIQIVLVNAQSRLFKEDEQKIKNTIRRFQERTGISVRLPIIYNNPLLDQYFPSKALPHEVWIDATGAVTAITSASELTEKNIARLLHHLPVNIHQKVDQLSFDYHKPLFIEGNGGNGKEIKFRSLLTGYIEGLYGCGSRTYPNKASSRYYYNQPLLFLLRSAYDELEFIPDNRIRIAIVDSSGITAAEREQLYCYELMIPYTSESMLKIYMRQDMQRYFGASLRKDSTWMTALVVKRGLFPIKRSATEQSLDLDKTTLRKHIHNYPLHRVIQLLNNYSQIPIINEAGDNSSTPVAIDLPYDLEDIQGLTKSFESIGLQLKKEKRIIEIVTISLIP